MEYQEHQRLIGEIEHTLNHIAAHEGVVSRLEENYLFDKVRTARRSKDCETMEDVAKLLRDRTDPGKVSASFDSIMLGRLCQILDDLEDEIDLLKAEQQTNEPELTEDERRVLAAMDGSRDFRTTTDVCSIANSRALIGPVRVRNALESLTDRGLIHGETRSHTAVWKSLPK